MLARERRLPVLPEAHVVVGMRREEHPLRARPANVLRKIAEADQDRHVGLGEHGLHRRIERLDETAVGVRVVPHEARLRGHRLEAPDVGAVHRIAAVQVLEEDDVGLEHLDRGEEPLHRLGLVGRLLPFDQIRVGRIGRQKPLGMELLERLAGTDLVAFGIFIGT